MSTSNPQEKYLPSQEPIKGKAQFKVVQHSMLFYWWPVWAIGFILTVVTYFSGYEMAVVPPKTEAQASRVVEGSDKPRDVLIAPQGHQLPKDRDGNLLQPHLTMATEPYLGIIFMTTLLLVIVITNVPLRGLWSVVAIVCIALLVVVITAFEWWGHIIHWLGVLDIRVNAAGYMFVSLVLFIIWAVTVFWFDQQVYIIFTPGLMKVRETIGSGETAYDATGMTIEHLRDDIFRHWILGLGSGDLVVHPAGPQSREIRLNNVLFVTSKLRKIEDFKATSRVTAG